ncbi:MAG: winged helix-turn-helix domain-containing protein [Pseudonocardia sp.]|nr:winged helix-turn-helix domain-containing protein [Pseudonocardia sp.]
MDQVRFRLLGPVAAYQEDGQRLRLGAPKQRSVLAVLLLHANQVVADNEVVASVWGETAPRSVRGRLQVHVSELRAVLGREAITRAGAGYQINVSPGELDSQVFADTVAQARAELAAGRTRAAVDRLRSALGLWRGPALGGASDVLVTRQRPGLEERRLGVLEELFDAELASGRHAQIIDELRDTLARHPLRERLALRLMLALSRCERRSEALEVYSVTRDKLVEELGIEPGQSLREMQARILNGQAERSEGEVPAASPRVVPAQLPRDVRGFAGRPGLLAALDRLTTEEGGACVISGPAGVGKTALAVHWAHGARDRFPDGQLHVDLRGYDPDEEPVQPAAALGGFLRSLGVTPRQLPPTVDEQVALYRSLLAGRRTLVLLDNARDVGQVEPLLPPSGAVVVTSRNRLSALTARWGAHAVSVRALAQDEALPLLEAALGVDRIAAEPAEAAELVRLCGGLPLALRIAAARAAAQPGVPIAAVVAELDQGDRLAALTLDGGEQSPVASAFATSYRALASDEQRLFRLLGLIPGPDFTAAAAAALAGIPAPEATRHLRALAAAHMVEQHTDRYRLHDLIRLYAAERARADPDQRPAWDRLVEFYLSVASEAAASEPPSVLRLPRNRAGVRPPPAPPRLDGLASPRWHDEITNIAAAAPRAALHGPHPTAWLLVDHLRAAMHRHGYRAEWRRIAPMILRAARHHDEPDVRAVLHYSIGYLSFRVAEREEWRASETPDALHHMNEAIRIARSCGWRECEAVALSSLGWSRAWTGDPAGAVKYTEKAVALLREVDDDTSVAAESTALLVLGGQYHLLGLLRPAEERYLQALALSARVTSPLARAAALTQLASARVCMGRAAEVADDLIWARDTFDRLESDDGLGVACFWLARAYWETGEHRRAHDEASRAVDVARRSGGKLLVATALLLVADIEVDMAPVGAAEARVDQVRSMIGESHYACHVAVAGYVMARADTRRGNYRAAADEASRALALARDGGYGSAELLILRALTETYLRWGRRELAEATAREALALSQETGFVAEERRVRGLLRDG